MNNFATLFNQASKQLRKDTLCDVIVFPKTESLDGDRPLATFDYDGTPNWDSILIDIQSHPELIAFSFREDLQEYLHLICCVLKEVQDDLHLNQFDSLRIYQNGVNLLCLLNKSRKVGRSAYIEINKYRQYLHQRLFPETNRDYYALVVTALLAAVIGALVIKTF